MLSFLEFKQELIAESVKGSQLPFGDVFLRHLDILKLKLIENSKLSLSVLSEHHLSEPFLEMVSKEDLADCREIINAAIEKAKLDVCQEFTEDIAASVDLDAELEDKIDGIMGKLEKDITADLVNYTTPVVPQASASGGTASGGVPQVGGPATPSAQALGSAPSMTYPQNSSGSSTNPSAPSSPWNGAPAVTPPNEKKSFWKRLLKHPGSTMWNVAKNFGKHVARGARRWAYDDPTLEHVQNLLIERTANFKSAIRLARQEILGYLRKDFLPKYKATIASVAPQTAPITNPKVPQKQSSIEKTTALPNEPLTAATVAAEEEPTSPIAKSATFDTSNVNGTTSPEEEKPQGWSPVVPTETAPEPIYNFDRNVDSIKNLFTEFGKTMESKLGFNPFPAESELKNGTYKTVRQNMLKAISKDKKMFLSGISDYLKDQGHDVYSTSSLKQQLMQIALAISKMYNIPFEPKASRKRRSATDADMAQAPITTSDPAVSEPSPVDNPVPEPEGSKFEPPPALPEPTEKPTFAAHRPGGIDPEFAHLNPDYKEPEAPVNRPAPDIPRPMEKPEVKEKPEAPKEKPINQEKPEVIEKPKAPLERLKQSEPKTSAPEEPKLDKPVSATPEKEEPRTSDRPEPILNTKHRETYNNLLSNAFITPLSPEQKKRLKELVYDHTPDIPESPAELEAAKKQVVKMLTTEFPDIAPYEESVSGKINRLKHLFLKS